MCILAVRVLRGLCSKFCVCACTVAVNVSRGLYSGSKFCVYACTVEVYVSRELYAGSKLVKSRCPINCYSSWGKTIPFLFVSPKILTIHQSLPNWWELAEFRNGYYQYYAHLELVRLWIWKSHQLHRFSSGQITHSKLLDTSSNHVTESPLCLINNN